MRADISQNTALISTLTVKIKRYLNFITLFMSISVLCICPLLAQTAPDSTTLVQTRDKIADLRAFNPSSPPYGLTVALRGYSTPGDGGGGSFYWNPNSAAADDGGSVIKPTSVSGSGRWLRSFEAVSSPVHATWFGADASGVNDSTSAVAAAYALLSSKGGTLYFNRGSYKISAFPTINTNGTVIECEGDGNPLNFGGVLLRQSSTTGDFITFSGVSDAGIKNCALSPSVRTQGFQIKVSNCFQCFVENVHIQYAFNGIAFTTPGGAGYQITNVSLRFMLGTQGVYFGGSGTAAIGGLTINNLTTDNPYPISSPSQADVIAWAPNKNVNVGQVTYVNGYIYQASTNGVTASSGSGPSGLPSGINPTSAFNNTIIDGTVAWRLESNSMYWLINDSNGDTLRVNNSALLNAYQGVIIQDQFPSASSAPIFGRFHDLEVERNFSFGMLVNAGYDMELVDDYHNLSLTNAGLAVGANAGGLVTVTGGVFQANSAQGISLAGGKGNRIVNAAVQVNSLVGAGSYPNIYVAPGVSDFSIIGNALDRPPNFGSQQVSYGIQVASGSSNYYYISGNFCGGTIATCVFDQGTGTNKTSTSNF